MPHEYVVEIRPFKNGAKKGVYTSIIHLILQPENDEVHRKGSCNVVLCQLIRPPQQDCTRILPARLVVNLLCFDLQIGVCMQVDFTAVGAGLHILACEPQTQASVRKGDQVCHDNFL